MDLVLHPKVKAEVRKFIANPSHALLIIGPAGSGKGSLSTQIAAQLLSVSTASLSKYPYFRRILPDNSVSIDQIRALQNFTSLKTIGKRSVRRLIIIEKAETMTVEAQNAFLKLLEEPPSDTVIVMLATSQESLLLTIQSRMQKIFFKKLNKQQIFDYYKTLGYLAENIERAYNLSDGHIGAMASILEADEEHPYVMAINLAKKILGMKTFERLQQIDELSRRKEDLPELLSAMRRISRTMLIKSSEDGQTAQLRSWHRRLSQIIKNESQLTNNAQPKLLLTDLFINL